MGQGSEWIEGDNYIDISRRTNMSSLLPIVAVETVAGASSTALAAKRTEGAITVAGTTAVGTEARIAADLGTAAIVGSIVGGVLKTALNVAAMVSIKAIKENQELSGE